MEKMYDILKQDFIECMSTEEDRRKHCPIKTCMNLKEIDGASVERFTVMPSNDSHGNFGAKMIYVNDLTGEYKETYCLNNRAFDYTGMTILRCALVNKLVLEIAQIPARKIGFIGNGRVNIATAKLLNPVSIVIHGAKGREGKNKEQFKNAVVDTDFSLLNECDAVFVCTNSYKREDLIGANVFHPKFIVVLDCGYTLNEDFRLKYDLFSDYPEQLMAMQKEEFPFDNFAHSYKSLSEIASGTRGKCVYVHGSAIADLSVAKGMQANVETGIE